MWHRRGRAVFQAKLYRDVVTFAEMTLLRTAHNFIDERCLMTIRNGPIAQGQTLPTQPFTRCCEPSFREVATQ